MNSHSAILIILFILSTFDRETPLALALVSGGGSVYSTQEHGAEQRRRAIELAETITGVETINDALEVAN